MRFIKHLLPICFLPMVSTLSFQTDTVSIHKNTDTVMVYSTGINNKIIIDSIHLKSPLNELILSPVKGEINQVGQNNNVDINTENKTPNNNKKNRTTSNKKSTTININQTGKNNNVKINSRCIYK